MDDELQDWELLHTTEGEGNWRVSAEIGDGPRSKFVKDYFSLDRFSGYEKHDFVGEDGSAESCDPCWIGPRLETLSEMKTSIKIGQTSGINTSGESELGVHVVRKELRFPEDRERLKGFGLNGESELGTGNPAKSLSDEIGVTASHGIMAESEKIDEYSEEVEEIKIRNELEDTVRPVRSFDSENGNGIIIDENVNEGDEAGFSVATGGSSAIAAENIGAEADIIETPPTIPIAKYGNGEQRKSLIWWKVPFELLKYYILKFNPIWSVSMAAAVMGFVILGRKIYNMKKKSRSLRLKVTFDDKKASQIASRAARLNEAFSMVRRVPMIRPSLPTMASNSWPAVGLR